MHPGETAMGGAAAAPARTPGAMVQPCPLEKRYAIEVVVEGVDGRPVEGIAIELRKSPQEASGQVSGNGDRNARFDGLEAGSYTLTLPELDQDAWKELRIESLPGDLAKSQGDLGWGAPSTAGSEDAGDYEVQMGDCLSNIAFQKGFAPDTIWQDGGNAELRAQRKSLHILLPADQLTIPKKRRRDISIAAGQRAILQLVAVPEILRMRFLTYTQKPRAGVEYLLQITRADGEPVADRKGQTDADGFLEEPIPPNAISGEVWLGTGVNREEIPIQLGHVNPIDDVRGTQSRLMDLNYLTDEDEAGELGEKTRAALKTFQFEHALPITGERDDATLAKLEAMFLS